MGILDKLFGRDEEPLPYSAQGASANPPPAEDEQAIARYRYLLKTAPRKPSSRRMLTRLQSSYRSNGTSFFRSCPPTSRMQNVPRSESRGKMIRKPWRAWQRVPKFADLARWSALSAQ